MLVEDPKDKKVKDVEFSSFSPISQAVLASRFKRCIAYFINSFIGWGMFSIGTVFGEFAGILLGILYVGAQLYFIKTYGQTIAKCWLNLRVLDYSTQSSIGFGKYIGREIIDWLFGWTSFLLIISGIVALVRDDRRSLTDLIIGSQVIQEQK
ncbi:RDD family protein [Rodentibacter haemolyticus]|uniref:RDD family protein n=1 Tax=Rodentibacter haemolyticus TaxID=2778911 RepID=A0ABX6UX20_9PAST|nr:RDD family protein [Rodentibacter haemolyticus]QPB42650.1 RDD family protein [Rodentibacter haemolyticus]